MLLRALCAPVRHIAVSRQVQPRRFRYSTTSKIVPDWKSFTPEQWKSRLSPLEYEVCRGAGTEMCFTGELTFNKEKGVYSCKCCGTELFSSTAKFESGTGWPSFFQPIRSGSVEEHSDISYGMVRTEVKCQTCSAHLGHVFDDGPPPTGRRYCINSICLGFQKSESKVTFGGQNRPKTFSHPQIESAISPETMEETSLLYFNSTKEVIDHSAKILQDWKDTQKSVANSSSPSWSDIHTFAEGDGSLSCWLWTCELMVKIHPADELRKEYNKQISQIKDALAETWTKEDLYQVFKKVDNTSESLGNRERRVLRNYIQLFERNGASLQSDRRKEYETLTKKLGDLCVKFLQNVNEDLSRVVLTKEELEGMPDDFLASLKREGDSYIVTMKYPDALPVLRKAKREETRKQVLTAFDNRAKANLPILFEAVKVRRDLAQILGYKNHASYVLEPRMARDVNTAFNFLNRLVDKLKPLGRNELEELLKLKRAEGSTGDSDVIHDWDFAYYTNEYKEKFFQVEDETVKQYFPMDETTRRILKVYEELLSLRFEEIPDAPERWHQDVKAFRVYDATSQEFMGKFFLDLFPRDGKYSHACAYPVLDTFVHKGHRKSSVATMVANFTKPLPTKPSLLNHRELVTYFHEFGHVMHNLCGRGATYWRETWFNVELDFLEAPSQMLENWCWNPDILRRLSGHYETSQPMPDALIESLIKSRRVCEGLAKLRQIHYSLYDLVLHSNPPFSLDEDPQTNSGKLSEMWINMRKETALIGAAPGSNVPAAFMHLAAGYDAGYYGYMWSEVFSADMFSRFEEEGVLNADLGRKYRQKILFPAATKGGEELLEDFLGRKPNEKSFLKKLGISE
eukprot:TRINITY_DN4565_c0_g1_i8.p1 TRINITY_DN4565_c0_g1~~TRINITY_DN4565_c0_g1_i8.p1  ORF type:complete len:854 (+),score=139.97 TRINITY_DN4565_c0_g1_i8:123-2684(+)